jgi:hypothetical protein
MMVSQLPVQDVTRAHITDSEMVIEMLQRITGVNDNLMGMVNGGRRTATEVRSSTTFGVNRLKTMSEYWSAQGMGPWTSQLIATTQQLMETEKQYRIIGDQVANGTDRFINVTPDLIAGFYDFVPVDGTLPVDRFAQVNLWQTLMGQVAQFPQIMQQYDFGKIFAFIAQLAGLKNISQFKVQVVPDQVLQAQAAQGNVVPAGAPGQPAPGTVPPGGPVKFPGAVMGTDLTAPHEPNQIPNMGATL